jgi:hypothetical protein
MSRSSISPRIFLALAAISSVSSLNAADDKKLTFDQRVEIIRGLNAEYAAVKSFLPRSRKALEFNADGTWDKAEWEKAGRENGPAARVGDLVQVTKVDIDDEKIVLEINGGLKSKKKWYERVEVGVGGVGTRPAGGPDQNSAAPGGTTLALHFHKPVPALEAGEIKKLLKPILDFEKRSASEQYVDTLPPEVQEAIKSKKAIVGMDRDQVLLALGRPSHKSREHKDGEDMEDWIFGQPPGKVTFVTFGGEGKVVKVKETFAGLGGSVAETPKPPR